MDRPSVCPTCGSDNFRIIKSFCSNSWHFPALLPVEEDKPADFEQIVFDALHPISDLEHVPGEWSNVTFTKWLNRPDVRDYVFKKKEEAQKIIVKAMNEERIKTIQQCIDCFSPVFQVEPTMANATKALELLKEGFQKMEKLKQ